MTYTFVIRCIKHCHILMRRSENWSFLSNVFSASRCLCDVGQFLMTYFLTLSLACFSKETEIIQWHCTFLCPSSHWIWPRWSTGNKLVRLAEDKNIYRFIKWNRHKARRRDPANSFSRKKRCRDSSRLLRNHGTSRRESLSNIPSQENVPDRDWSQMWNKSQKRN